MSSLRGLRPNELPMASKPGSDDLRVKKGRKT